MATPLRLSDYAFIDMTVTLPPAEGSIGVVYFGMNQMRSREMFALKKIKPQVDEKKLKIFQQRFIREALIWVGLFPHPCLLTAERLTIINDEPYLVLEYASQGSLKGVLKSFDTLSLEQRYTWAQMIATGLTVIHAPDPEFMRNHALIHRDLNPNNILIMKDNRAVITDFGLSRVWKDDVDADDSPEYQTLTEANSNVMIGTAPYMAPEQWEDPRHVTPAVDVYAFGQILAELLTGKRGLLPGGKEWREAHVRGKPRSLRVENAQIPKALEGLYLACLEKRPEQRPTALELVDGLRKSAHHLGCDIYQIPPYLYRRQNKNLHITHLHSWAVTYDRLGKYEDAMRCIERALRMDKVNPDVLLEQADLFTYMERYEEAIGAYELAKANMSDSHPSMGIYWFNSAGCYMMLGQLEKAREYGQTALRYRKDAGVYERLHAICFMQYEQLQASGTHDLVTLQAPLESALNYAREATQCDPQNHALTQAYLATNEKLRTLQQEPTA